MEKTQVFLEDMKAIELSHYYEGKTYTSMISFNQFRRNFIEERWTGERRTGKTATMFGYMHTKTTVTNPFDGSKSVRTFDFPNSREEAEERHDEYMKNMEE